MSWFSCKIMCWSVKFEWLFFSCLWNPVYLGDRARLARGWRSRAAWPGCLGERGPSTGYCHYTSHNRHLGTCHQKNFYFSLKTIFELFFNALFDNMKKGEKSQVWTDARTDGQGLVFLELLLVGAIKVSEVLMVSKVGKSQGQSLGQSILCNQPGDDFLWLSLTKFWCQPQEELEGGKNCFWH